MSHRTPTTSTCDMFYKLTIQSSQCRRNVFNLMIADVLIMIMLWFLFWECERSEMIRAIFLKCEKCFQAAKFPFCTWKEKENLILPMSAGNAYRHATLFCPTLVAFLPKQNHPPLITIISNWQQSIVAPSVKQVHLTVNLSKMFQL